jgi:putative ABC transport system permease protein
VVVVGPDMARQRGLHVGSRLTLPIPPPDGSAVATGPGRRFTVVGILSPTLTAPDQWAIMSMADAGQLVARALPGAKPARGALSQLANGVDVYGQPGASLDAIARQIQATVVGLQAIPPSAAIAAFQSLGAVYTTLTTGSALVALVVGGLSVVNTMLMAVADRVREIGIKRAIGAPAGSIMAELLVESALLGALGGLVGLGVGWGLTALINVSTEATQGTSLFLLTPRLVLAVPLFSIGLGVVAGLVPALRAARLDPVSALRSAE